MNALFLIRQDDGPISIPEFVTILKNMPGSTDIRADCTMIAAAEADYSYEEDLTIVRLSKDEKTMTIHGIGKASIHATCEIHQRYAHPLRLFDMDYTFDINLDGAANFETLKMQVWGAL